MLSSVHEQMSSEQSPRTGVYRPAGALHNELSVGRAPSLALRSRPPSVIVQAGAAAQHMAEARYLALPSAADWRPIPGKRTPRSLRPIYTAESRRREISALTAEVASPQSNSSSWHHEGQAQGKNSAQWSPPSSLTSAASSSSSTSSSQLAISRRSDRAPSNRSEAAILAMDLDAQLAAAPTPRQFRVEIAAHDVVFDELIRQVSVHCTERGALLRRLKHFYSRSADAGERLGKAAQARAHAHVAAMEDECASLRAEVARLKKAIELYQRPATADSVKRSYDTLSAVQRRALHHAILNSDDAKEARDELLSPTTFSKIVSELSPRQRASLLDVLSHRVSQDRATAERAEAAELEGRVRDDRSGEPGDECLEGAV